MSVIELKENGANWKKYKLNALGEIQQDYGEQGDYGELLERTSYKDGEIHRKCWAHNWINRGYSVSDYVDGELHGYSYDYTEHSAMNRKALYDHGVLIQITRWDDEGTKTIENYKDSMLNGEVLSWYRNGRVKEQSYYVDDQRVGDYIIYNEDGSVSEQRKTTKSAL